MRILEYLMRETHIFHRFSHNNKCTKNQYPDYLILTNIRVLLGTRAWSLGSSLLCSGIFGLEMLLVEGGLIYCGREWGWGCRLISMIVHMTVWNPGCKLQCNTSHTVSDNFEMNQIEYPCVWKLQACYFAVQGKIFTQWHISSPEHQLNTQIDYG